MSVGVGEKDIGGVTLPILKWGCRLQSKLSSEPFQRCTVPQFLTVVISTPITGFETLLFSNNGIDWIGILMLSDPPLVLTKVIMGMAGLVAAAILIAICAVYYFMTFFL